MRREKYTIIVQKSGEDWVGSVEELPGANTQGASLKEVLANIPEAIQMTEEANAEPEAVGKGRG